MHKTSILYLFIFLLTWVNQATVCAQGKSGIEDIDTLPLYDWRKSPEPLSYSKALVYSALIPGGGQFYSHHPVRGGFLLGMELVLGSVAFYSNLVDIPNWRRQARDALDSADALFIEASLNPSRAEKLETERLLQIDFARKRTQLASQQADLTHSQFAWAAGLHLYGILDAVEMTYNSNHPTPQARSVKTALYRGLMFPGGAQLYNRRYGKFGLLWMTLGASAVSAYSRQQMVDLLQNRLNIAQLEVDNQSNRSIEELEKNLVLFRKRRNQYFWGMSLFYVYSVLDGMVDASLSDFDAPHRFAFNITPQGAFAAEWKLPF